MNNFPLKSRVLSQTNRLLIVVISFFLVNTVIANERKLSFNGSALLRHELENGAQSEVKDRLRIRTIIKLLANYQIDDENRLHLNSRTGHKNNPGAPAVTLLRFDNHKLGDKHVYLEQLNWLHQLRKGVSFKVGQQSFPIKMNSDLFWDKDIPVLGVTYHQRINSLHAYPKGINSSLQIKTNWFELIQPSLSVAYHFSTVNEGAGDYIGQLASVHATLRNKKRWQLMVNIVDYQGEDGAKNLRTTTQSDGFFSILSAKLPISTDLPITLFADLFHNFHVQNKQSEIRNSQRTGGSIGVELKSMIGLTDWQVTYQYAYVEKFSAMSDFAQNGMSRFAKTNFKGHDLQIKHRLTPKQFIRLRLSRTEQIIGEETGNRFRLDFVWRW